VKFLIAGLGSIGRRHLRNLITLGESDIILLRSGRATLPDGELEGYLVETDLQTALRRHKPQAVIVANPTALHLDVAIPAAQTGCAILLEKPASHSTERLEILQHAAKRSGARVLMGFQFRFHPALQRAKELMSSGELGRLISADVHFGEYLPAWHPWEDYRKGYAARAELGGGVVLTQCHALDYLPWLIGPARSLWAFTAQLGDLEINVEDTAKIGMRFDDGALAGLHLDLNQQPPAHDVEIIGTQGLLQANLIDGMTRIYRIHSKEWEAFPPATGWERNHMFMEEMRHFVAITRAEVEPIAPLEDGMRVQRLIEAIHEAHRTRCAVDLR